MPDPMTDDDVGFGLPDPPYVAGDHYTTCRGCDHCAELEDRYFAEKDRLQEKVTALQGELVDAELAAAEETMPDQMTGGAAMSELRAPDPTLSAECPGDLVYVGLGERAHTSRDCPGADHFGFPISSHYARWFAVPCRECFPDAPPPGHSLCSPDTCGGARGGHMDPDLTWQVRP